MSNMQFCLLVLFKQDVATAVENSIITNFQSMMSAFACGLGFSSQYKSSYWDLAV